MVRITFTQRNKFTQSLIHTQTHTRKAGNNLHTHTPKQALSQVGGTLQCLKNVQHAEVADKGEIRGHVR